VEHRFLPPGLSNAVQPLGESGRVLHDLELNLDRVIARSSKGATIYSVRSATTDKLPVECIVPLTSAGTSVCSHGQLRASSTSPRGSPGAVWRPHHHDRHASMGGDISGRRADEMIVEGSRPRSRLRFRHSGASWATTRGRKALFHADTARGTLGARMLSVKRPDDAVSPPGHEQ
jgi:hypothetical protein